MTKLPKLWGALAIFLTIAACDTSGSRRSPAPPPSITVSYVTNPAPAIAVFALNPAPLSAAELVSPGGQVWRAPTVDREIAPAGPANGPSPTVGIGGFGGSGGGFGTGIGLGFPLGGAPVAPSSGQVRAQARVPIEDDATYRRDWQTYIVRLRFGAAPGPVTVADIPAPEPR